MFAAEVNNNNAIYYEGYQENAKKASIGKI